MSHAARLLGFAFANADLLFEIDGNGTIVFATGAGQDGLKGKSAGALFQPSEGVKFATFAKALNTGERAGPFKLKLIKGEPAMVSMFRLGENGSNISCTLARPGSRGAFTGKSKDEATDLAAKDSFLSAAAEMAGHNDTLTLVEVPDLPDICASLPADRAENLMRNIGEALNAGTKTAGRLSETSFGAVSDASKGGLNFATRIRNAFSALGLRAGKVEEALLSMKATDLSSDQKMLAVRYVVDRFASGDHIQNCGTDIAATFSAMMDETQARLKALTENVAEGAFSFAYQPIVKLATGEVSHYEALVRFPSGGVQDTVKFVEALGMADAFDLAVALKIVTAIEAEPRKDVSFAFNISGHTISTPSSFGLLAGILARKRKLASRLLIEITETAEITDFANASKAIAGLRALGYRVGLDDFGAGAASLNYLHAFQVDFVKFDGSLVKKIGSSSRDDTMLKGLAKLCGELGVHTIAECIEDDVMRQAALDMGFDAGQGYFLGKPDTQLLPAIPKIGKRKGTQDSWG